jgi:hypothetical protein
MEDVGITVFLKQAVPDDGKILKCGLQVSA